MVQQVWHFLSAWRDWIAGWFFGSLATWFFSWLYYRKAGNELRQEAKELRRITNLILVGLQDAGLVSVNWDKHGRATGVNVRIQLSTPELRFSAPAATIVTTEPEKRANDDVGGGGQTK